MAESLGAQQERSGRPWPDQAGGSRSPSRSPTRSPQAANSQSSLPQRALGDAGVPERLPAATEVTSIRYETPDVSSMLCILYCVDPKFRTSEHLLIAVLHAFIMSMNH